MSSMPGGLLIASGLYTLPAKYSFSLPILVRNDIQNDIAVIAEMYAVQHAMKTQPRHDASQTQLNSGSSQIKLDFGPFASRVEKPNISFVEHNT